MSWKGGSAAVLAVMILVAAGCASVSVDFDSCDHTAAREATIAVGDTSSVRVIARAGSLRIDGSPGLSDIKARGTACASSQDRLDEVELIARRSDRETLIEARIPENQASMDIVIEMPDSLAINVNDSSGDLEVRNVRALELEDGSGDIIVKTIIGDLTIKDGSGGIQVSKVGGNVRIEDGSDDIQVSDVFGDVIIEEDGSGNIFVFDVQGSFIVREDGSGDIEASDIFGNFAVERDGSGSIEHENIGGRVSLP